MHHYLSWCIMLKTTALVLVLAGITFGAPANDPEEQIIDPDELKQFTTPPPSHQWDDWQDWDAWQAPPEIVEWFPYFRSGRDETGRVVYVLKFGKWNFRELAQKPQEVIDDFWKYFEQLARRVESDGALNNHQGFVLILDWEGFSLGSYASPHALQLALKMYTALVRFNEAIEYGFDINVNFSAETFINMSRPFIGTFNDKFEIYGTQSQKWKPKLLQKIPASQLSPVYGGDKEWKPLPMQLSRR